MRDFQLEDFYLGLTWWGLAECQERGSTDVAFPLHPHHTTGTSASSSLLLILVRDGRHREDDSRGMQQQGRTPQPHPNAARCVVKGAALLGGGVRGRG